jgi:formate dehydrogenase major subunit
MPRSERLTSPRIRDRRGAPQRAATWDEALERASQGLADVKRRMGPQAFGLFSCSKATNEMNFTAGKFARVVVGSNNVDSCNRT